MEKAILKQNSQRVIQREVFSEKYKTLSSIAGSNLATAYALLKMSFYDVKSQAELLNIKGLEVKPNGKRIRYSEYLDFVSADELRYLNKGLDAILDKMGKENSEFSGFPFIYNELIEIGKQLRYDFLIEVGTVPENVAPELLSVKRVKKSLSQTKVPAKKATFTAERKEEKREANITSGSQKNNCELFIVKTVEDAQRPNHKVVTLDSYVDAELSR